MATITLYRMTQDKRVVNKLLNAQNTIVSVTAHFKGECTVTDPEIELAYDTNYLEANYMYISDFGRYYFIRQTTVSEQRIIFSCHVDVLKSFSSQMGEMQGIIARNENNYNMYLADKYFKVDQYKKDEIFRFPESKFSHKFMSYALIVAGAIPNA